VREFPVGVEARRAGRRALLFDFDGSIVYNGAGWEAGAGRCLKAFSIALGSDGVGYSSIHSAHGWSEERYC
jgi:hypothetical protein